MTEIKFTPKRPLQSSRTKRVEGINQANRMLTREVTLVTGRKVSFFPKVFKGEEILENTFVDDRVNGRNQSLINEINTLDVSETMSDQQYYPAWGCRAEGKSGYSILDGSRRRSVCARDRLEFEGYYTDEVLTLEEQIALAKTLQTAKEHHASEMGQKYKATMDAEGLNQKEVAALYKVSEATVTRALKALEIDIQILQLVPDLNKLSIRNWDRLHFLQEQLKGHKISVSDFCSSVNESVSTEVTNGGAELDNDLVLAHIELVLKDEYGVKKEAAPKFVSTPLRGFRNKNRRAIKKVKGRTCHFELSQIPEEKLSRIEEFIKKELEEYE